MIRRALRLVAALGLVTLSTGVAQALTASDGCCDEHCEVSLGGKGCPPNCSLGACAKVKPAIDPARPEVAAAAATRSRIPPMAGALPVLPLVTSGVFHPPRS